MADERNIKSYRDLVAWQKAMDLVESIYACTSAWPKEEVYALTNQVRRAAVSVPSNIAEGQGRASGNDFLRYLRIARGSLFEIETQLLVAERLEYIEHDKAHELLAQSGQVSKLISGLIRSLDKLTTNN